MIEVKVNCVSQSEKPLRRSSNSSVHSVSEKKDSSDTTNPRQPIEPVVPVVKKRRRSRVYSNSLDSASENCRKRKRSVSSQSSASNSHHRGNSRSKSPSRKNVHLESSSNLIVTGVKAALRSNSHASLVDGLPYTLPRKSANATSPSELHHKGAPVKSNHPSSKSDVPHSYTIPEHHHKAGKVKKSVVVTSDSCNSAGSSRAQKKGRRGNKREHKRHKGRKTGSTLEHSKRKRTTGSCASSRYDGCVHFMCNY